MTTRKEDPITARIESHTGADVQQAVVVHYARLELWFEQLATEAYADLRFDDWQNAIGWQDRIARARRSELITSPHWSLAGWYGP